jgi:hypothetical protein
MSLACATDKHCRVRRVVPPAQLHGGSARLSAGSSSARGWARRARRQRRRERESFKARKEKLKTISEWEDECRRIVQKIARIRDKDDGCISCHLPADWDGQWHGSHFRSHGACSSLQFHLWNIHKACSSCNHRKGGNIIEYRPKLIAKIGQERYDWLMAQPKVGWKHGPAYIEYMKRFKKVMGRRPGSDEDSDTSPSQGHLASPPESRGVDGIAGNPGRPVASGVHQLSRNPH